MGEPVRLQLSRKRGFDLQALSLATNGLQAVHVARPGPWGDPFVIAQGRDGDYGVRHRRTGNWWHGPTLNHEDCARVAVNLFRAAHAPKLRLNIPALAGKNLACWCKPGEPCHADVLLELANPAPSISSINRVGE